MDGPRRATLAAVLLLCGSCGQAGPRASSISELQGTPSERVAGAVSFLLRGAAPPSPVLDARCAEERLGDGFLGPSDRRTFCVLQVAPADIGKWSLAPGGSSAAPFFVTPGTSVWWWPTRESFASLERIESATFTGLGNGWVAIERSTARVFLYSFST